MSANKKNTFDTKITEDDNGDSGFLSGQVDDQVDEEDYKSEPASEEMKVFSDSASVVPQPCDTDYGDSGIQCLSECLSGVQLGDTPTPHIAVSPPEQKNIDPIRIFYQPDAQGDTQLHIAAVHGCEKSVATLIRVCPNKVLLDVANDDGHTPLHLAAMCGNAVVTRMLVCAGLSLGVRDRIGETPLHKATAIGHIHCMHALLAEVKEHPHRKLSTVLDQKNYNGEACVHLAAAAGYLEALQALVYYGADINATENLAGWTPLHIAARRGDVALVQYLTEKCHGVAMKARDYANRTPRRLARHNATASAFAADSDDESDSDDDMFDSDAESWFEKLRGEAPQLTGCC